MAKLIIEAASRDDSYPISAVGNGYWIVTQEEKDYWVGQAILVCGPEYIRLTGSASDGFINSAPNEFCPNAAMIAGMRVRPLRPGEKLVCVE